MQELVYEERDRTAFLTLNRPGTQLFKHEAF